MKDDKLENPFLDFNVNATIKLPQLILLIGCFLLMLTFFFEMNIVILSLVDLNYL